MVGMSGVNASGWSYTTVLARCLGPLETVANEGSQELCWVPLSEIEQLHLLPSFWGSLPCVLDMERRLNR